MNRKLLTVLAAALLMAWSGWATTNSVDFTFDPGTGTDVLAEAVAIQPMNGDNTFTSAPLRENRSLEWKVIGAADFNNDNKADILWRHNDGRVAVWSMNGTEFVESYLLLDGVPVAPSWRVVCTQ